MLNRESVGIAGKRDRRGIALMTVIVATVIVGVLATGAVFVGIQEQRMGEGVRRVSKSFGVAEGGAVETLRNWSPIVNNGSALYPAGGVQVPATAAPGGTGVYQATAWHLNPQMWL